MPPHQPDGNYPRSEVHNSDGEERLGRRVGGVCEAGRELCQVTNGLWGNNLENRLMLRL